MYLEMDAAKRADYNLLSQELMRAYNDNEFVAYSKLRTVKWTGEPVDVFANNIWKLARGSGLKGDGLEQVVKLVFITGFPDHIAVELQQIQDVETMSVGDVLKRARILASNSGSGSVAAPAVGRSGQGMKCFGCGGPHVVRDCPNQEKREKKEVRCCPCGGGHIVKYCPHDEIGSGEKKKSGVPVIDIRINGKSAKALVDTGCTRTMVREGLIGRATGETVLAAFDGREVKYKGSARAEMSVGEETVSQEVMVMDWIVGGIDAVIGMDTISRLGGVKVQEKLVQFGNMCAIACGEKRRPDIVDKDFEAYFDGESWEVRYFWTESGAPELRNNVSEYAHDMDTEKRQEYEAEVERWIDEGILISWRGEVEGVIPLMAVEQPTKNKIRPVLDFRELNESVKCHTGDDMTDVCSEKLREWRQLEGDGEMVDLKAAYLQIKVAEELWQYQLVRYKDTVYCLIRLGFGLSSAPRIMSKILKTVLEKKDDICGATSSFIDDIMVNTSLVPASRVVERLKENGLVPEALEGRAVLGLKLRKADDGQLIFERAHTVPEVSQGLTRKELFSICGKLVGHYPKAGWLRVACSYVKRHAEEDSWDDYVGDGIRNRMKEIVEEVKKNDPVKGVWRVPKSDSGTVWCDASELVMRVVLEIGGTEVEDASWMRKKKYNHNNVAELEAVLKGINLCAKWNLKNVVLVTDSATVFGWIKLTLTEEKKVKTKGAAEILVKRRLGILKTLIQELGLTLTVKLVKSEENKADALTRVRKRWLVPEMGVERAALEEVKKMHDEHHMGVERTWYLAKRLDKSAEKETVKAAVRQCQQCQSIDPAPASHTLAIDVTHYAGRPYLSMVDCNLEGFERGDCNRDLP